MENIDEKRDILMLILLSTLVPQHLYKEIYDEIKSYDFTYNYDIVSNYKGNLSVPNLKHQNIKYIYENTESYNIDYNYGFDNEQNNYAQITKEITTCYIPLDNDKYFKFNVAK